MPAESITASDGAEHEADAVKERVRATIDGLDLPPKQAAAILASVNLPSGKRQKSALSGKATVAPPKSEKGRRKGDDKDAQARKPVLVLGQ